MCPSLEPDTPTIVPFRTDHCTGRLLAELESRLAPLLESIDTPPWNGEGTNWETVKETTVRTVRRGPIDAELHGHVKLFRAARWSDRARDGISGPRGAGEFDALLAARARGIPAVRPLAAGQFQGSFGSRSFLVTESVPGAQDLPAHPWPETLARSVGQLLRRAHDLGLHAPDLHRGNMLRTADGELWLVDLTGAHLADSVHEDDRARALAFFLQDLDGGAADPVATGIWRGYAGEELHVPRFTALFEAARRQSRRIRHRALTSFGRRAFRACRHTEVPKHTRREGHWFHHIPAAALREPAMALIRDPSIGETLREGRRGGVFLTDTLVLKTRTAAHARRLFRASYWLLYAGVAAPQPVALWIKDRRGAVVTARLPAPNLADELHAGLEPRELRDAACSLGEGLGRIHAHGLRNRDLKLENLVRHDGRVYFVDLDGVRRKLPKDQRGIGADLGRLLAAFRAAGEPGGDHSVRQFLASYRRARKGLLTRPLTPDTMAIAENRAQEWATAHAR